MKKKTIKVKRNKVKCKKATKKKTTKKRLVKKTIKKKIVQKKKVVKKKRSVKKTTKKKVAKRKRRKRLRMEDLYPILNKVQMTGKPASFVVEIVEAEVIENTIKDLGLIYRRNDMKTQVEFFIKPNEYSMADMEDELMEIEYLDDEIPEIGEIFP